MIIFVFLCSSFLISSSSSVGTWIIAHVGQQSKLYIVFTAKIIQYLQIILCTCVYDLPLRDYFECSWESFPSVGSCYFGGQLIPIPGGKWIPVCIVWCPIFVELMLTSCSTVVGCYIVFSTNVYKVVLYLIEHA